MKLNIEIDCTPDEAREFLGLPDVKPMQEALLAEMQRRMLEVLPQSPETMLKAWLPAPTTSVLEQWQKAMLGLMASHIPGPQKKGGK
jgi:Family of unknown function (DUF6489)